MSFRDTVALKGKLTITLNGAVVQKIENLVVTAGKEWIATRMKGSGTAMTHMAIGTGTVAAVIGDTTLGTEVARVALGVSGGVVAGAVISFETTFAPNVPPVVAPATTPVSEAAIFTAASAGDMLARTVFAVVNKGVLDSMTITWEVTIS